MQDLRSDIKELKTDVTQLKTDVTQLKADVKQLQNDVGQLQIDVKELQGDVKELQARTTRLEQSVSTEIRMNEQAHHYFEFSMGIGFAAVAIIVAFVGIYAPALRERVDVKRQIQSMVDKAVNRVISKAQC